MNNTERLFTESDKFQTVAQERLGVSAAKWLNIAFKLDYISLSCKEKIDNLLRKADEMKRLHVTHAVSNQDILDMMTITEIASNTRFSETQLKTITQSSL